MTHGPEGRYGGIWYTEKAGFDELFEEEQIAEQLDLMRMTCHGLSVAAARKIVDRTCARFSVPLFILRDFDVAGFSIASTLHQSNRRYRFSTTSGKDFKVVDLGLRLTDVERLRLQSEPVSFGRVSKAAIRKRLARCGALEREIDFLLTGPRPDIGQRVELNAMTSPDLIEFLRAKFAQHGVDKVVPAAGKLADAYRLFVRGDRATVSDDYEREMEELRRPATEDGNGADSNPPWDTAPPIGEKVERDPLPVRFKSVADFCKEYVPLAYVIEGVLRTSSLYSLTARTSAGKTAFNIILALAVATGRRDILGVDVTQGRVAYFCFENPDDCRMRLMIAAFLLRIDLAELSDKLIILDVRRKPEDIHAELSRLARSRPFTLVLIDTLSAFFDGDDISDPVQGGEFMRRCRPLTQIAGLPAVLVSAHPVKNATEEQLIPLGSGNILNEVDGNLTLWKSGEPARIKLYWQGKLRGLEFQPLFFRFELTSCSDVVDVKGREILLPTMMPASEQSAEEREAAEHYVSRKILRALLDNPETTQRELAELIGLSKSALSRKLDGLAKAKLAEPDGLGKWMVTAKGRKALKPADERETDK